MTRDWLRRLIEDAEGSQIEFKRTTGELKEGLETICGFLNGKGAPFGVTLESLSGPHFSKLRNPLIAETFHRTGAVEVWGRGTNRVIDECVRWGIEPPTFTEMTGSVIVTFRVATVSAGRLGVESKVGSQVESAGEVTGEVAGEVAKLLAVLSVPRTRTEAQASLGLAGQANFRDRYLRPALEAGFIEMTIPDRPNSRLQKYRLTEKGRVWIEQKSPDR